MVADLWMILSYPCLPLAAIANVKCALNLASWLPNDGWNQSSKCRGSKTVHDKFQEWVPVAAYVLPLGPDSSCSRILLYEAKWSWPFPAGLTINIHWLLAILCPSLFLHWLSGSGKAQRLAGQGFLGLPTSYRLIWAIRENPVHLPTATALARSLWVFDA